MRKHTTGLAGLVLLAFAGVTSVGPSAQSANPIVASSNDVVEIAIVLDTSDSMKPLIDATRLTLWDIVNELTVLDPAPQLRVALLTYGNTKNDRDKGWVRIEAPLTSDLDLVSQRLFQLETQGGAEYVGRALEAAVEDLAWTDDPTAVKLVFIAGNESAEQDQKVDMRSVALEALGKNLVVHAVFCGRATHADAVAWKNLADLSDGEFAAIDLRSAALMVHTPFDTKMAALGTALNQTYVPIGGAGRQGLANQSAEDENASTLGDAALATRAQTKAGELYAPEWDLIDALASGRVELYEIDTEDLPEIMRGMSTIEQEDYLAAQALKREEIRRQIRELTSQRRSFVKTEIEEKGLAGSGTFDRVVRNAIRAQIAPRSRPEAEGERP